MAAEDVLHDLGAISIIGSDSQAMGRIGETVLRTWQTAHVMKARYGSLARAVTDRCSEVRGEYIGCAGAGQRSVPGLHHVRGLPRRSTVSRSGPSPASPSR